SSTEQHGYEADASDIRRRPHRARWGGWGPRPFPRGSAGEDNIAPRTPFKYSRGRVNRQPRRDGAGADHRPATMQKGALGQRAWPVSTRTQLTIHAKSTNYLEPLKFQSVGRGAYVPPSWARSGH